ncbi:MAG TPA: hypothetical protein VM901_05715 [Bdellovibrionota bacterium]|nr:hypothetical protein [Bdellovibrionota bacterium]
MADVFDFKVFQAAKDSERIYDRWVDFYNDQPHDELLEALVFEHESGFPLRTSDLEVDRMRHRALIHVMGQRAQTQFMQDFLSELQ